MSTAAAARRPRRAVIAARIATGLNQREMAREIGVARNALKHAEDGEAVRLFTARKIAAYYGREIPDLFPDLMPEAEQ